MKHISVIISLSEKYLNFSILHDKRLHLNGYKLAKADNPNNIKKRSRVGIYFKAFLVSSQVELDNLMNALFLKFAAKVKKVI